ncbi:DUF1850 domain-containing protein [Devosia sp. PTR5]|uniref:DUF1850 domain-containing protein n=1 Tax=Devosia oryzisoli TaxID=2774138 RepID=A0A927FS69_9HYPH|nr:DUF1850 domain-containing protein [Devosia oryzisoli]
MMLCIASAAGVTALAVSSFSLSWTHSVEHTRWEEHWQVEERALQLVSATVEGSGAGIDLPPDARWVDGGWTYSPHLPPLPSVRLAASGATGGGWRLCTDEVCMDLGQEPGEEATLSAAPNCEGAADRR